MHTPALRNVGDKLYVDIIFTVDHNTSYPDATRTFAVITTGALDSAVVYKYMTDGTISDITDSVNKE